MKKWFIPLLFALLVNSSASAQLLDQQDELALKIPNADTYTTAGISSYVKAHYRSDSARARACFVWVANNIAYDVEKLKSEKGMLEKTTIENILKTRKAVCQGYADLYIELLKQCNIPSMLIPGYGRFSDGTITRQAHAWVAAQINNKWWLFDPTWSAGPVANDKFIKSFSNRYYKLSPEEMIRDHMPFDPLHQFLFYPISANEFYDGKKDISRQVSYFNYVDSLNLHQSLSAMDQGKNTIRRIQNNGIRTDLIRTELDRLLKNQQLFYTKSGLDAAYIHYNQAIALFNTYGKNKNEQFANLKGSDIQLMLDSVYSYIVMTRADLGSVVATDDKAKKYLYDMKNSLYQFSQRVDEERLFVKKYLGKG